MHVQKLNSEQVIIKNTSGAAYEQGDLVYEQGFFGDVVDEAGIANNAEGVINIAADREIQTDQINSADTFAVSTNKAPAIVYFDHGNNVLRDNKGSDCVAVGALVKGGNKDANDVIVFKTFEQPSLGQNLTPGSVSATELASDSVTTAKILNANVTGAKIADSVIKTVKVDIDVAEIKALRATPIELVAAPGAGKVIQFESAVLVLTAGTEVLTESADNMAIMLDDGSGMAVSQTIEATGFIDGAADKITNALAKIDTIADLSDAEDKNMVIKNTGSGEYAGNASDDAALAVYVTYRVITL